MEIRARMRVFPETEDGSPRNAAISTDQTDAVSGETEWGFHDREVLISKQFQAKRNGGRYHGRGIE